MQLASRDRMRIGFGLAYGILFLAALVAWVQRPLEPPRIQGILLAQAMPLESFSLIDHRGARFANANLQGQWHLVSYGFTTCPDVCPTTLSQLAKMARQLVEGDDLRILFYTVDHRRDTVAQLASYLPYFDSGFIGLTHLDNPNNSHLPFENSLGIAARLEPIIADDGSVTSDDYRVSHGLGLLLINPRGELQAIFRPEETAPGQYGFDPVELLRDYRAIRAYTG